jgi:hypothetical protein
LPRYLHIPKQQHKWRILTTIGKSIERQQIVAAWIQAAAPLSSAKAFGAAIACEKEKNHCPRDRHSDQATVVVTNEHVSQITEHVDREDYQGQPGAPRFSAP